MTTEDKPTILLYIVSILSLFLYAPHQHAPDQVLLEVSCHQELGYTGLFDCWGPPFIVGLYLTFSSSILRWLLPWTGTTGTIYVEKGLNLYYWMSFYISCEWKYRKNSHSMSLWRIQRRAGLGDASLPQWGQPEPQRRERHPHQWCLPPPGNWRPDQTTFPMLRCQSSGDWPSAGQTYWLSVKMTLCEKLNIIF